MVLKRLLKSQDKRMILIVIVVTAAILILISTLSFQYYRRLQETVKLESGEYMQEISKQIATNVSKTINDNFSILGTISTVLKSSYVNTFEEMQPVIQAQKEDWHFQNIFLVDHEGVAYDPTGNTVNLDSSAYLQDVVLNRQRSMTPSQEISGSDCIVFAIPLDGVSVSGQSMSALIATYDPSTFDQIMSLTAFGGEGYVHVIRRDGSIVIRSSSENAPFSGYNILTWLSTAAENQDNFSSVKQEILSGHSGQTEFVLEKASYYMAYTSLTQQEWTLMTFVPVAVANEKSELLMKLTLMLCGLITLLFSALIIFLIISFYRHKQKLEDIAYIDDVTGGNTIMRFYDIAQGLLAAAVKPQYALVFTNVEKFKILNEQFGRRACDDMLRYLERGISKKLTPLECIGRQFADNFCILVEYTNEATLITRFGEWYDEAVQESELNASLWLCPLVEYGVYVISNDSIPFPIMIDRAKLAIRETAKEMHGRLRYAVYDEEMRRQLVREKQLEDMMERSLETGEFRVYLQPKYVTETELVGGAEALVRWVSKSEGMIYPDEFIALFEKNGFILRLDLWVFEQVCRTIRAWLNAGITPIRVSVNCSRVHLRNPDFLVPYKEICTRCGTPPNYLEIELTENVVFEDVQNLAKIIDDIHSAGFGCSMDDFGSGYSSLNLIQDIPVDTIKLDKVFFRSSSKDLSRMESVVGSIIGMSKSLNMITVAEGVEERIQVDMLKRLGCDYIQGYYFARPMPIGDFETQAFGHMVSSEAMTNNNDNK